MPLEEHYSGDSAWSKFVDLHLHSPLSGDYYVGNENSFEEFSDPGGASTQVMVVAVSIFGVESAKEWLGKPIPALDMKTPMWCIEEMKRNPNICKRIREYLMRFPV